MKIEVIDINKIIPNPSQARENFNKETLQELADTIKAHGILEPIVVRKVGKDYELVAGERRVKASKLAKVKTIPAIIKNINSEEQAEQSLIENIQREDLSPHEKGKALKSMKEQYKLTNEQLAERVGLTCRVIETLLKITELSPATYARVSQNTTDYTTIRNIADIDDKSLQMKVAEKTKDWTNKEAREIIPIIKRATPEMANEIISKNYDVETAIEAVRTNDIINEKFGVVEATSDEKSKKFLNDFQNDLEDISKRANYMAQNGHLYEDIKVVKTSVKLCINTLTKLYDKQLV